MEASRAEDGFAPGLDSTLHGPVPCELRNLKAGQMSQMRSCPQLIPEVLSVSGSL